MVKLGGIFGFFKMQITGLRFQRFKLMIVIIVNVILAPINAHSSDTKLEYQVKAVFLGNFAKFVRWPEAFFPKPDSPYVFGVLGDDPFGCIIDQAIEEFSIDGRKVIVKRFKNATSLEFCHILFISRSQKKFREDVLVKLREVPTLTVSEMNNFCQEGGIINFILLDGKVRFEINTSAAKKARLKLGSDLLSLAKAIY